MSSVLTAFAAQVFTTRHLTIKFRDRILAGLPAGGKPLDFYIQAKQMSDAEKEQFLARVKGGALTDEEKDGMEMSSSRVFERDPEKRLCLWHGNVKALIRECFVTLGLTQVRPRIASGAAQEDKKTGAAGGRQTLQHGIHVSGANLFVHHGLKTSTEFLVFLKDDGTPFMEPSGVLDKCVQASGPGGNRSALGRHEYLTGASLRITLMWPTKGVINEDQLKQAWALAQEDGLGACRSQGFGKFDVTKWE